MMGLLSFIEFQDFPSLKDTPGSALLTFFVTTARQPLTKARPPPRVIGNFPRNTAQNA
jgi:hypothetical protein